MKRIKVGQIVELVEKYEAWLKCDRVKKGVVGIVLEKFGGYSSGWYYKTYHPASAIILTIKRKQHRVPVKYLQPSNKISQYAKIELFKKTKDIDVSVGEPDHEA